MRLYRSDAGWQEREKDICADAVIVSMSPTKLSLGMVASLQSPLLFHPAQSLYLASWLEEILDQPAGGRIGAVGVGFPCGYGGHGCSCPGCEKNALDSARSRSRAGIDTSRASRLAAPEGFEPRDADSDRDLNESG